MLLALILACTPDPVDDTGEEPWVLAAPEDLPEQDDPPPLFTSVRDGAVLDGIEAWEDRGVPELRRVLAHYVYGASPDPAEVSVTETSRGPALGGEAELVELSVDYGSDGVPALHLALFLPATRSGPVPLILGLNKCGNHSVTDDPAVALATGFIEEGCAGGPEDGGRGLGASAWSISRALEAGFAVATVHQSDIVPDDPDPDLVAEGIQPHFDVADGEIAWGAVGAWSYGLSRALDGLLTLDDVDPERIIVFGHSRRGKAALWAAAQDPRFTMVWAHQSGIAGQALSRGSTGETVEAINVVFPHWFGGLFREFAGQEERLPLDQHQLLALVAPRPLLVTDGDGDAWAYPSGAEAAVALASPAWALYEAPPPQWTLRPGEHEVLDSDWVLLLDFAASHGF